MASICYLCEVVEPLGAPGLQIDDEAIIEEIVAPEEKEQLADQAESLLLVATNLAMKTVKLATRVLQQEREFKKAIVMSGYIGFFNGAYEKVPGLKETPWYELGLAQVTEYLKESCGKDKELEIQDLDDPKEVYKQLQASSRAIGNSHYCSLQRQFQGTT
ncbi:hypothetical protein BKA61DRAFT_673970 [Leptodontidium sp. MPI-SDFR-AT-0119]|nr:hypothetical protein BKA61DRAFT_673970 [Leptodontidium sp. MPI-SDFR-AT-0119]